MHPGLSWPLSCDLDTHPSPGRPVKDTRQPPECQMGASQWGGLGPWDSRIALMWRALSSQGFTP